MPRWITPSEICLILHILGKLNSLIALLFIQNNSQFKNLAKTCLPALMLSLSSIAYVQVCLAPQIFSKQQMSPSKLSSCYFKFAMFLAIISPSSSCSSYSLETSEVSAILVFTMKITQSHFQVFSVKGALTCRRLHFWRHFLVKQKILSNLVISKWLW